MEKRKIQSKDRYLLAFLIGTFLFVFIFSLSYALSYFEFQRVSGLQGHIAYEIFEDKLSYSLFNLDICLNENFKKVSQDLGFQGRIIDDLEKKLGKQNRVVLEQKKFYTLIELEHFEFVKSFNQKCGDKMNIILFFYSNEEGDLGKSEEVGRFLSVVHSRNSDLIIYSFDINLDSNLIEKLKEKYGIEVSSTIVINEGEPIVNPKNLFEIEAHLK